MKERIMPWGELEWSHAEMLDEMEFMRWCDETFWPQAVSIWIRLVGLNHEA